MRSQALSAFVAAVRGAVPVVPEFYAAACTTTRPLPPFYPRANLNNRHSSHSRRKMVRIARQGDLQGNPTIERVEGQFNEYRSGSGTEPSAGSAGVPRHFGVAFDAGRR